MPASINVSNTWRSITSLHVNVADTWRTVTNGYVNVAGTWRTFFTSALTPSIASTVTISRNNATYPSTLTGTNFRWTNSTSLTYVFQKSSDNVNFVDIGLPASINNPSVGSSNTVTYALTVADMPGYTSYYRFVVTAVNSTFSTSAVSTSTSVSVLQPAPINNVPPTITPSTGTVGVTQYSVNSNGSWNPDDADGTYTYLWQSFDSPTYVSAPGTNNLSTYTPPANFFTLGYQSPIRCRVTATNPSGSTSAISSNTAAVTLGVPAGGTITLTPSGTQYSGTLLTATTSGWSGSPTSYNVRIYGSTFDPPDTSNLVKASSSTASATYTITNGDAAPPPLYFKAFATATNSGGTSVEVESNVVLSKLPSASALATSDTTLTPQPPFSIAVANTGTTNQGRVTWENGTNTSSSWVSSVTPGSSFTGTDGGSLLTSQVFTITSTQSSAVATVNNKNRNRKVTVSWNQDGALSYSASVTISGSSLSPNTTFPVTGNTSGSSGSFDVNLSTGGGTVRVNSITVYTKTGQTGGSFTFTPSTAPSTTPTDRTVSNTGSGSITFTPQPPVIIVAPTVSPTSGTAGVTTYSTSNGVWTITPTSYEYQWQYQDQPGVFINISGATSSTYAPPSNFFSGLFYASPIRCRVTAFNGGSASSPATTSNTASVSAPVSIPSGGTVSISTNTGNYNVGSIITYSTSGWSGSPTSYSLRLYNGTNPVLTSDPLRASTSSTSGTYTITSADVPNFFKAFATASNSAGTSTEASSTQVGPAVAAATVPGTVNSLTASSLLSGTNLDWSASWSAPSSNGGSAITGYRIYVERAGSSSGPWLATTTQSPAGTGAFTQASPRLVSSATTSVTGRVTGTSATWIRVWVAAVNSVGTGSYTSAVG